MRNGSELILERHMKSLQRENARFRVDLSRCTCPRNMFQLESGQMVLSAFSPLRQLVPVFPFGKYKLEMRWLNGEALLKCPTCRVCRKRFVNTEPSLTLDDVKFPKRLTTSPRIKQVTRALRAGRGNNLGHPNCDAGCEPCVLAQSRIRSHWMTTRDYEEY